ncbi:MAG: PAS domain S-box protein, partial [Leptolyngbya sp.]|nr:PAS domain S-box protein [Candidatus Melainabacteria bacterium]
AKYIHSRDETFQTVDWLKAALAEDTENFPILKRVEGNLKTGMQILDRIKTAIDTKPFLVAARLGIRERIHLQPTFNALAQDLLSLVRAQKKIEEDSPATQRRGRERNRQLLIAAFAVNTALAFLFVLMFNKGITSRLNTLVDNTKRMKSGEKLNSQLSGADEIASLDAVFHEMAFTLRLKEELLKESEQRVRAIIEKVPIGLLIVDEIGAVEFSNPTLDSMFAVSEGALVGRSLASLFARPAAVSEEDFATQIKDKATGKIHELQSLRSDGEIFPVEFSITDFDNQDGKRVLGIVLDVSERQEIQRMRQAFVSMVSHELRTPLTAVSGFLALLEMGAFGELPTTVTEQAGRAEANVGRLMKLITDLLDLEKMDSGTLNVSKSSSEFGEILRSTDEASRTFAESKGIRLQIEPEDAGVESEIYVDADRIVQVLVNLISNAVKFSPPQGLVTVSHKLEGDTLEMRVTDQGRGVPAKYRDVIFERFQQVEAADAKQKGGTGLGLAICKTIVEQHNGTIAVDSEEGKGSTFWFRIQVTR